MKRIFTVIALLCAAAAPLAAQGFDDDFNSLVLKSGWSWTREDRAFWRLTGQALEITTQPGALNGTDYNNVRNLLLQPAPAPYFRIETHVTFAPDSTYHNAGLIYYLDDDNYVRVSRGIYDQVNGVWMEWEVGGVTNFTFVENVEATTVWLRLSRSPDNTFRATYSPGNGIWAYVAQQQITFPAGTPRIGLQAANGAGVLATSTNLPAQFDYFAISTNTGAAAPEALPLAAELRDVHPVPALPASSLTATLDVRSPVQVSARLIDAAGRTLWTRDFGVRAPGTHALRVDAPAVPGMYLLDVTAGTRMRRGVIVR